LAIRNIVPRLDLLEAYYPFEALERGLEYRWCLQELADDARYRLAEVLLSSVIQSRYKRIIIDGPPRFTLGFVNGIAAATHVFVPTLVDQLAAEAVIYFAQQFRKLAPVLNPALRIYGVTGTVNDGNAAHTLPLVWNPVADNIDTRLRTALGVSEDLFIRDSVITRQKAIAQAVESGIPYIKVPEIRAMYDQLARAVNQRAPRR
jgi:cellulose biosynthesis protein BcsQ